MSLLCPSEMTLSGDFRRGPTTTIRLMTDRQVMRLERLAKLFDKERGLNTRVRSRRASDGKGSSFVLDLYARKVYISAFA